MQRVTNCILKDESKNQILMLKKPRYGWYVVPGGKMEQGESIKQSVVREFKEETGLDLINPELRGVFTFVVMDQLEIMREWMMFTFICDTSKGALFDYCKEGELEWVPIAEVLDKPMAEGDYFMFKHILANEHLLYGTFIYTPDDRLIDLNLDPPCQ
ncbi:8-oxo-dGTP diphosphatase [Aquibacillus sp. 3ASR75-11]|uniref:8-oxo-dGTP diphosphatase n=1 Tax=Terrihalobacillus insolitus TaxID=2950438 RepID=A0A9X4AKP3_9BACI|nr:8-oxo-dGTP diphosphatase [Terrihalobacillus insolitus]MDC3412268.1 8-oxo-dGTP diphosphatase [Terrihalobacillus insolitus]MDC3423039.1 8-oxo-dGTP diphosphatase [Terrihalobacillus insolitus]